MVNFELHICYKEVTLIPSWPWLGKDSGSIHASAQLCLLRGSLASEQRGRSHLETSLERPSVFSELSLGEGGLGMSPAGAEHTTELQPIPSKTPETRH